MAHCSTYYCQIWWPSKMRQGRTVPGGREDNGTWMTTMTCAHVKVIFAGFWIPHKEVQRHPHLYDIPHANLQYPPHDPQTATGQVGQCVLQLQRHTHTVCWAGWINLKLFTICNGSWTYSAPTMNVGPSPALSWLVFSTMDVASIHSSWGNHATVRRQGCSGRGGWQKKPSIMSLGSARQKVNFSTGRRSIA